MTARARMRRPDTGRPRVEDSRARPAIASARSTDGSHRVRTPKRRSRTRPAPKRAPSRSRRRRGESRARTKATFWPLTTSRWVRPAARKSSVISTGWPRSSPRTKPEKSVRRSGGSDATPARRVRRIPLANRLGPLPSSHRPTSDTTSWAPTWRRSRYFLAEAATGRIWPASATCSPASRERRRAAAPPRAWASTRLPPMRTSTRTPPKASAGSLTRVAVPRHWPTTGGRNPASARHPRVDASRAAPRITTAGRRATSPASATAATGSKGSRTDAHAPAAVASAITTTVRSPIVRPARRPAGWRAVAIVGAASPTAGDACSCVAISHATAHLSAGVRPSRDHHQGTDRLQLGRADARAPRAAR